MIWSRNNFRIRFAAPAFGLLLAGTVLFSCKKPEPDDPILGLLDPQEEMSGGLSTTFDFSQNAFGQPSPLLDAKQKSDFVIGNSFFKQNWVAAPASTSTRDGLGPLFNANSCSSCHLRDGRGLTPSNENEEPVGLLFRLSAPSGATHPFYGGQLQNRALLGIQSEASVAVSYEELSGKFPDGVSYSLRKPIYTFKNATYGDISDAAVSPRLAQQLVGMGLLEAIDERTILAATDENDLNNDGISGRPNYVKNVLTGALQIGRFGWKANQPSVQQQTAGAFLGDLGITSSLFPNEDWTPAQSLLWASLPTGGSPEINDELLSLVTFYTASLAVPARRNTEDKAVLKGKALFLQSQCAECHIPKIKTGTEGVKAFHNQTIFPYTDLLLHNMGDQLADQRQDGLANGKEWRTPPLWGIGLAKTVNGAVFFMHDGRARTLEEAILWHGGEAQEAKSLYMNLKREDRNLLLKFLESL